MQTVQDLAVSSNNKSQCDVLLLDFSKAFDGVFHCYLMLIFNHCGIRNLILDLISAFYLFVLCGGCYSSPAEVISGALQGTVLGLSYF